jgi:hypothetical protein
MTPYLEKELYIHACIWLESFLNSMKEGINSFIPGEIIDFFVLCMTWLHMYYFFYLKKIKNKNFDLLSSAFVRPTFTVQRQKLLSN